MCATGMCGTGRNTAHKIHTQPLSSTRGMFSAHFTISVEPGGAILASALKSVWEKGKMGKGQ